MSTEAADLLSNPFAWIIALAALAGLFALFGRRDRYQPFHYDAARAQGRELPRNQTRRITVNDAVQIPLLFLTGGAALGALIIPAPALWILAAMFLVLLIGSFYMSGVEYFDEAAKDGIPLEEANGGIAGFTLAMVAMVLFAVVVVGAFFVVFVL